MRRAIFVRIAGLALATLFLAGCVGGDGQRATPGPGLTGTVQIDGSSTVFPITEAVGEEFQKLHGGVRVTVGISGTGGGFKKFCAGETDISDASRPIKESEREACAKNGVEWVELKVAYDGLSVVVNPQNTFASCITVQELKRIWEPGSTVQKWSVSTLLPRRTRRRRFQRLLRETSQLTRKIFVRHVNARQLLRPRPDAHRVPVRRMTTRICCSR